jgi:osmotically-inducible protein OsmY
VKKHTEFITGLMLGAGLMYLLDPTRGRRRRALIRDQGIHATHEAEGFVDRLEASSRHLRNRMRGAMLETRARMWGEEVPNSVIEARVRSEIGRIAARPSSIRVAADGGHVTLSGQVLQSELQTLLARVEAVRGVEEVENNLEAYAEADLPGLQGTVH